MRQLIVKQLSYDLTPVAGLALVGNYLNALQPALGRLDAELPVKGGVANSDIVRSYLGLLVQGKSDFDAIENFRGDAFFKQALGIGLLPSSPTLRQRMDARAAQMFDLVPPMIETLLAGQRADYGVLPKLTLEGWTTSLPAAQFSAKAVIALYADHGTHEQFHSEFKTDLDLTRLPRATRGAPTWPLPL